MTAEVFERSPLAARADDLARLSGHEVAFAAQLSVRTGTPGAFGLPAEPNTWTTLEGLPREALWLGPDEWLIVGAPGSGTGFDRSAWAGFGFTDPIVEGLEGADALVDVSAGRTVIELGRDDARDPRDLLEQGCSIDLHPRSWRAGMCAQTVLAHVPVILQERDGGTRVFVRPSFAGSLVDRLLAAASIFPG